MRDATTRADSEAKRALELEEEHASVLSELRREKGELDHTVVRLEEERDRDRRKCSQMEEEIDQLQRKNAAATAATEVAVAEVISLKA